METALTDDQVDFEFVAAIPNLALKFAGAFKGVRDLRFDGRKDKVQAYLIGEDIGPVHAARGKAGMSAQSSGDPTGACGPGSQCSPQLQSQRDRRDAARCRGNHRRGRGNRSKPTRGERAGTRIGVWRIRLWTQAVSLYGRALLPTAFRLTRITSTTWYELAIDGYARLRARQERHAAMPAAAEKLWRLRTAAESLPEAVQIHLGKHLTNNYGTQ